MTWCGIFIDFALWRDLIKELGLTWHASLLHNGRFVEGIIIDFIISLLLVDSPCVYIKARAKV